MYPDFLLSPNVPKSSACNDRPILPLLQVFNGPSRIDCFSYPNNESNQAMRRPVKLRACLIAHDAPRIGESKSLKGIPHLFTDFGVIFLHTKWGRNCDPYLC